MENARGREVLEAVEAPGTLLRVEEVPPPVGGVLVAAAGAGHDAGNPGIGMKDRALAPELRRKAENAVLVLKRVVVAPGEERPNAQSRRFAAASRSPPGEHDGRRAVRDEELVLDARSAGKRKDPAWPGLGVELGDAACAIGSHDVARVALRA